MSRLRKTVRQGRANIPRFYSPTSFFNRPLGPGDVLAADQTPAQHLANQIYYGYQGAGYTFQGYSGVGYGNAQWPFSMGWNGPSTFSHPLYCVRPSVAAQNISMLKVGGYDGLSTPSAWGAGQYFNLQLKLNAVPIPDKTLCPKITGTGNYVDIWAGGTDKSCCIWNLDTDEMWEFWELTNNFAAAQSATGATWTAAYGGYIPSVSTFSGVLPNNWGSRAASLGEMGGIVTYQDMWNAWHGEPICHVLSVACGMNGGTSAHVPPATRGDGPGPNGNNVPTIPNGFPGAGGANPAFQHDVTSEGQRFRFPANVDITNGGTNTHPVGLAGAQAIRDYGLCITDTSGGVAFYIEDDRTFGSPYHQYGASASNPFSLNWAPWGDPRWDNRDVSGTTVWHHLPWSQLQILNTITN